MFLTICQACHKGRKLSANNGQIISFIKNIQKQFQPNSTSENIRLQSENILIAFSSQSPTQASIIKYIFRINESNILLYLLSLYDIQFKCMSKISIRFFNDREVRAIWDETDSKWWFSVLDIVGVLNAQDDYTKNRNYWKYLKTKLKKEESQLVSVTNQLKMTAADGKRYLTDVLDYDGVVLLAKSFPNTRASRFVEWFTNSDETIDGKSKSNAMQASVVNPSPIHSLLASALTNKINDRETFMKGIDYSYYYEQED